MNIATITHVQPTGEPPYQSQHGPLYSFIVSFDDNTSGKANAKTQSPPYKAGDRVAYEVSGQFKGMNNIKVNKNPDKFAPAPQVQPPYQAPAPVPGRPAGPSEVEAINPVFGATVGMAMNQAIQLLTQGLEHDEIVERIITPAFWYSVHEVASDVIRVARELEKGRLAPSPTERTKRPTGQKNAPPAHPDSHPDLEAAEPLPF